MKWELSSGTRYYSSGQQVSYGGNTYLKNRVKSIPSFQAGYIDRKDRDFSRLEIELDNLADDGSSSFPFTVLDASVNFEDSKITIYAYSPDASDAALMWWGFAGRPRFNGKDKTVTVGASFFWDSLDLQIPAKLLQQAGFNPLETSSQNSEENQDEFSIPIIFGAGDLKVRPLIYRKLTNGSTLGVNFILSGTQSGAAFSSSDLTAQAMKLFGNTPASRIIFFTGGADSAIAPTNLTAFPDGAAHPLVAYGYAEFPITNEIKDRIEDLRPRDIKCRIANGRPLVDTGLPSENIPLIVKDILRDPIYGCGLPNSLFDATVLTSTANYTGTRYQARYELHEQVTITSLIQQMLGDAHCYITFDNGLIQIRAKRNNESSVATFATCDSGFSGRKIDGDSVEAWEKDFSELVNQATLKFRKKREARDIATLYDPNAQARAGGTAKKVVGIEIDEWDNGGLYDYPQVQINLAILIREEQNGNLFISFDSPLWDCLDVSPGDIITVRSPDIPNNGSNFLFRVKKQTFDTENFTVGLTCQVYKTAIYNDDAVALGVDLLRGADDTSAMGRPPDVVPVSLAVQDVGTNDGEGKQATLRATFTVPAFDPTAEQAEGTFREPPIAEVEIWWHFTDESINLCRRGGSLKVTQTNAAQQLFIDFHTDYRKTKTVEAFFVSIGANRARAPLGYIPDPSRVTVLNTNLSATAPDALVNNNSIFNANDYVIIEREIARLVSQTSGALHFVNTGGNRQAFFDTISIGHPAGTEVSVAKLSYPSLTRSLDTPRFTYPVVVARDILQRGGDGVRVRWLDISADNEEAYLIYWSTAADASTNANKLGSTTPAWYLSDPLAPPAGVNLLSTTRQRHHWIPEEDIGTVGTAVYVRVAARNNKRNFSSALSALLNSSVAAPGSNAPPSTAPTVPSLTAIIQNIPKAGSTGEASVTLRIFASESDHSVTFIQASAQEIIIALTNPQGKTELFHFDVTDGTQVSQDCVLTLTMAALYVWTKTILKSVSRGPISTGSVNIAAGGFQVSATAITGLQVTSITADDERHSQIAYQFVQPTPPVLLAKAIFFRQISADPTYYKKEVEHIQADSALLVAGTVFNNGSARHPKNTACNWKVQLVATDGSTVTSAGFSNTSRDEDTGPPNNGVALTIKRARLKKGGKLLLDFDLPLAQMNTHTKNVLIIHDNNATGAGRRFYDPATSAWVATYPDGTTELSLEKGGASGLHISPAEIFVGGRTQFFVRVGVWNAFNGGSATYSGDLTNPITQAGSEADSVITDTATPNNGTPFAAPSVEVNSKGITVEFPIVGVPQMTTFKSASIRIQIQDISGAGGCYWNGKRGANMVTSLSVIDIDIGREGAWTKNMHREDVRRAFQNQFGSSAQPFFLNLNYTLTNALGTTGSFAKTILYSDWLDAFGTREAALVLDVAAPMSSNPFQLLPNSDFFDGDGSVQPGFHTLKDFARWLGSNPGTSQSRYIDNTLNSIYWDFINHLVIFRAIDRWLVTDNRGSDDINLNVRGIEPTLAIGDWTNVQFQAKSPNTTFAALLMRAGLYDGLGNLLSTSPDIALAAGQTLGATMQPFGSRFQLTSLPGGSDKNLYFALRILSSTPAIDDSHLFAVDRFNYLRGRSPGAFGQRAKVENRRPYAYSQGVSPSAASQVDLGNSVNANSGFFDDNTGGRFQVL
jgi:hypothetical protein